MKLSRLRSEFERLGATDPLWAVLSVPEKRRGKWDPEEFFQTGVKDVAEVLANVAAAGVTVTNGRALDFGCGVGRLSQALATHFDDVVGVDIAASMVETARHYDRSAGRCTFVVNTTNDLAQFPSASFDFIYSHIVFQHMEPRYSLEYMREFTRLLRPGGVVVFQIPVPNGRSRLSDLVKRRLPWIARLIHHVQEPGEPMVELYAVPQERVERALVGGGVTVFATTSDPNGGRGTHGVVFYGQKR